MVEVHEPSADNIGAGASADGIEITPEMIEAGLEEFLLFDARFEHDHRELVASIYEAMERARVAGGRAGEAEKRVPDQRLESESSERPQ